MGKISNEDFIKRAREKHGDKYDYSLSEYKGIFKKIKIICPIHNEFEQTAKSHLDGKGCKYCGGTYNKTVEEIITISSLKHNNKYDYSLVDYLNSELYISIICPEHGLFKQKTYKHMYGQGCPKCVNYVKPFTNEEFFNKLKNIHGERYDYSLVKFKSTKHKIDIICREHGLFKQKVSKHIDGQGCPRCNDSKGETEISKYLLDNKFNFISQKRFDGCRNKIPLRFDFYLPDKNICIEYNGIQHYEPIEFFNGKDGLISQMNRDKIKEDFCIKNNIKLIVIRYDESVNEILKEKLI
jgi:hypothetical protein